MKSNSDIAPSTYSRQKLFRDGKNVEQPNPKTPEQISARIVAYLDSTSK